MAIGVGREAAARRRSETDVEESMTDKPRFGSGLVSCAVAGAVALLLGGAGDAAEVAPARPDVAKTLPLAALRLTAGPLKRAQLLYPEHLLARDADRTLALYSDRA